MLLGKKGVNIFRILCQYCSTLGFIGFLPYAPGTFGSVMGFALIVIFKPRDSVLLLLFLVVLVSGIIASGSAEKALGKDSGRIVIDEFCGYLCAVLFLPKVAGYLLAGLILFRVFDILKPPPIRKIEETMQGGIGIMLDDVMAAVYTNICLQVWRLI